MKSSCSGSRLLHVNTHIVGKFQNIDAPRQFSLRSSRRRYAPLVPPTTSSYTTEPVREIRRRHAPFKESYYTGRANGAGTLGLASRGSPDGREGYPFRRVDSEPAQHSTYSTAFQRWPSKPYIRATAPVDDDHKHRPMSADPNIFRSTSMTAFTAPDPNTPNYRGGVPVGMKPPLAERQFQLYKNEIIGRHKVVFQGESTFKASFSPPLAPTPRTRPCTPIQGKSCFGDREARNDFQTSSRAAYVTHQPTPVFRVDKGKRTASSVF